MAALVSVCIPAYNNADTIRATIESVMSSDYEDIEIIVVDDCSVDDTYVEACGIADPRISVYRNEKNLGMAGNWNRCLSLCHGEYVRLLCADDRIDPDLIGREVAVLDSEPSVVMVSSDTAFIDESGRVVGHYDRYHRSGAVSGKSIVRFSFFTRDYLGAPLANLFRKSAAGEFDAGFSYIIDYDFFVGIALRGDVYIIRERKNYFMLRAGSNTSAVLSGGDSAAYVDEHKRLVKKYAAQLGQSGFGQWLSVMIRRVTVVLGGVYLKWKK